MTHIDRLWKDIEQLRCSLNNLVENDEDSSELLQVSRRLDELLVQYYVLMEESNLSG